MARRKVSLWLADAVMRLVTRVAFRLDAAGVEDMPQTGPFILISNHVSAWEFPPLRALLRPRRIHALAKAESWNQPILGWLLTLWSSIPIRRGEADMTALRKALQVLEDGEILGIMPEGTRSHDGSLGRGNPGIAVIALKSGCPIVPMAFWGVEHAQSNMRRFRRTDFHFRVGKSFRPSPTEGKPSREDRQRLADEIMEHVAALLPESHRGYYASSGSSEVGS